MILEQRLTPLPPLAGKIKCSIAARGLWLLPRAGLRVPALGSIARQ